MLAHSARSPIAQSAVTPAPQSSFAGANDRPHRTLAHDPVDDLVVDVAGAVKRPGLYHLHSGDRYARGIALAGGFDSSADAAGVNLAQRAADGDEIDVPIAGESPRTNGSPRHGPRRHSRSRRHSRNAPPRASVDVNLSDAAALARIPGVGDAIARRIVELRERDGSFTTLDELLDVAGMTDSRLERARPYLRQP